MDRYANYEQLAGNEEEGTDYAIEYVANHSTVLIVAPHGGKIEFHTSAIARALAGRDFSYYSFKGLKKNGNRSLHITSHRFDEPTALAAVRKAETVLAIHGAKSRDGAFAMAGGLDRDLARKIALELERAGFEIRSPEPGLGALHPDNICNRGKRGKGVQLELSQALRKTLGKNRDESARFVRAVRKALLQ